MEYAPIEKLADKIVRPGIDKHLVPLCLFKGTGSFGRIHRWWNFAIAAMEQDCANLSEITKLSHNPDYSQLLGPEKNISHMGARGFFSRLRMCPDVTDNIPQLTEYAEFILPNHFHYDRVPLESASRRCASWRVYKTPKRAPRVIEPKSSDRCYPYILHDPQQPSVGADLVSRVHAAVPKGLPEQFRADVCQDIIVAILSGEMSETDLQGGDLRHFVSKARKVFADKWKFISADAPMYGEPDGPSFIDTLTDDQIAIH